MKLSCLPVSFFDEIISGRMTVRDWARMGCELGLDAIDRTVATKEIGKTREAMLRVRRDRKLLIKNHLLKT